MTTRTTIGIGVLGAVAFVVLLASARGMHGTNAPETQRRISNSVPSSQGLADTRSESVQRSGATEYAGTNYVEVQLIFLPSCCPCPPTICVIAPCFPPDKVYLLESDILLCTPDANGTRWVRIAAPLSCDVGDCPRRNCVAIPSNYETTTDISDGCVWNTRCFDDCESCWGGSICP